MARSLVPRVSGGASGGGGGGGRSTSGGGGGLSAFGSSSSFSLTLHSRVVLMAAGLIALFYKVHHAFSVHHSVSGVQATGRPLPDEHALGISHGSLGSLAPVPVSRSNKIKRPSVVAPTIEKAQTQATPVGTADAHDDDLRSNDVVGEEARDDSQKGGTWRLFIGTEKEAEAEDHEAEDTTPTPPTPTQAKRPPSPKPPKPSAKSWNAYQDKNYVDSYCKITDDVVEHVLRRIRSTALFEKPYPHAYVTDVFPAPFYRCLMKKLVAKQLTNAHYVRLKPTQERYTVNLSRRLGARTGEMVYGPHVPPDSAPKPGMDVGFWTEFGKKLSGAPFVEAWLDVFSSVVDMRFESEIQGRVDSRSKWAERHPNETYEMTRDERRTPDDVLNRNSTDFYYELSMNRDLKGYGIKPHTDSSNKWVTTLFFLPSQTTSQLSKLGTSVVMSRSGRTDGGGGTLNWNHPTFRHDLKISKTARFLPNTLFAFPPCLSSWHAVVAFGQDVCRDTIQGFVMSSNVNVEKRSCDN